ncbi:sulfatase [Jeotgalibaca sp. MA1X17-3]|uniref:sulfatase n=1 Tax=Jeotgalibaca sp. MA1X17-3 TaxID=2908211 RepID=UPI001F31BA61|nr:sulfatase [Jeotgalibaca sp. MA1X17-3]UJF16424.1 sulfatase [Jeotgalibaca sp. MA1X17-3]
MRAILVLMDTLRKDVLTSYNEKSEIITPNLDAFCDDSLIFDNHYIGSTPCMPARRDLLTGRLGFLERSWGPIEPFDITFPKLLQEHGVFSHITTDHCHYFRLGGEGYINQYNTWDYHRGQEGDPWISKIKDPEWMPEEYHGKLRKQYQANREKWYENPDEYPTPKTFMSACEWLEDNKGEEDFFLQVEVFDPHEPFDVPSKYMELYNDEYEGPYFETPVYGEVDVPTEAVDYIRNRYSALCTMTDEYFGKLIDKLKELGMYEDTLIIATSDHGYFLGERNLFGKNYMHDYNELAAIPLVVKDPKGRRKGEREEKITQNIDVMPTVLDYFDVATPEEVQGKSWFPLMNHKDNNKKYALYGAHGITINYADGEYTYFRAPNEKNSPLFEYTAIPTTIRHYLGEKNKSEIQMGRFLKRTEYPVYKFPIYYPSILDGMDNMLKYTQESLLFNIKKDPKQKYPIKNEQKEMEFKNKLKEALIENECPEEQFQRLDLE